MLAATIGGGAAADPRVCRELAHELDLLTLTEPAPPAPDSDDPAIGRQLDRLLEAERQAERAGCGPEAADQTAAECRLLHLSIRQMEQNLARLEGRLETEPDGDATSDERRQLLEALAQNDCQEGGTGTPEPEDPGPNEALITRIFGGRIQPDAGGDPQADSPVRIFRPGGQLDADAEMLRTFCVRSCDGYVFPLSQNASRADFARDQASCEAACPGTATELYYRSDATNDPDLMTSAATGQLYMDLATAGLYRRAEFRRPPSCSCTAGAMPRNFEVMTGNPPAGFELRQSLGTVPTASATSGSVMVIEAPAQPEVPPTSPKPLKAARPDPERKVRVVGPAFFPAPEAAAAPRAPAPIPAR